MCYYLALVERLLGQWGILQHFLKAYVSLSLIGREKSSRVLAAAENCWCPCNAVSRVPQIVKSWYPCPEKWRQREEMGERKRESATLTLEKFQWQEMVFFALNKTISDGGITVDFWIIKIHTSN